VLSSQLLSESVLERPINPLYNTLNLSGGVAMTWVIDVLVPDEDFPEVACHLALQREFLSIEKTAHAVKVAVSKFEKYLKRVTVECQEVSLEEIEEVIAKSLNEFQGSKVVVELTKPVKGHIEVDGEIGRFEFDRIEFSVYSSD